MRMRKKPNLIPRMERCAHLLVPKPEILRGRWHEALGSGAPLYLELGCGKGRFTVETAAQSPQALLIAMDRVADAMVIAMERADERALSNVFFFTGDAALLGDLFAPGEVDRVYINFCDPWPHTRHAKRRLTSDAFLARYEAILSASSELHFKTDNAALFDYSVERMEACGWTLSELTRNLHENGPCGIMTDYEVKFYEQGIPIHRCVARK